MRMDKHIQDSTHPPDVREFLEAVGEALRDRLERIHRERGKIPKLPQEDEDTDESGRVFPSQ